MIRFQTATLSDVELLTQLINSAYRGVYSKQGWTTEADILGGQRTDPDSLKELISTPLNQIEMAFDSTCLIGSVHLRQELPDILYFGMLTIEPTLQGQGLGKQLLQRVEGLARQNGLKKIRMTVIDVRKELIAYYERRGYRATGKTEPFPEHDPKFGLPKMRGLMLKEFLKEL